MSPDRGPTRLLRAAVFAAVCLTLATTAHALGGGGVPSLVSVSLCAVPVLLGSVWLSGARRGRIQILASLTLAQAGLHLAFHLMSPAPHASGSAATATSTDSLSTPVTSAHSPVGHLDGAAGSHDLASALPGPAMLTWHILAIAATAWVLCYGEETAWRLALFLFPRWEVPVPLRWALANVTLPTPEWFPPRCCVGSISERGPPWRPVLA